MVKSSLWETSPGTFRLAFRVYAWIATRSAKHFAYSLPALMFGICLPAGMLLAVPTANEHTASYLTAGGKALEAGNYPLAFTCYDALASTGQDSPEVLFGLALACEALGRKDQTYSLMDALAPRDRRGYPEAHYWWARTIIASPTSGFEAKQLAERHLLFAIQNGYLTDSQSAEAMLGELYLDLKQPENAVRHLRNVVARKPAIQLQLAKAYQMNGDRGLARSTAESAVFFFRNWLNLQIDSIDARLQLADCQALLEDYPGAATTLIEGLNLSGDSRIRTALARTYVLQLEANMRSSANQNAGEQFGCLQKALELDPTEPTLLLALGRLTKSRGRSAEEARAMLRGLLIEGKATALVHLALGLDAFEAGKQAEAIVHLEQAHRLSPQMAIVTGNLAWVLSGANPPNHERALALLDYLVQTAPQDPWYRDMRATVLVRMARWADALVDLQVALPTSAANPAFHKRLAEAYDHLNVPGMAAEHRRRAEQLVSRPYIFTISPSNSRNPAGSLPASPKTGR